MTTYMIVDGNGNALTDGLQEHEARRVAQSTANDRVESVWLSESDSEGMGEEIVPDERVATVAAKIQLDAWQADEKGEEPTIDDVFRAIYARAPEDDENAVDLIYAARDELTDDEARGVLRVLWADWPGFRR